MDCFAAARNDGEGYTVIACDKREAFAQGSEATKQSILSLRSEMDCFAALAMTERVTPSLPATNAKRLRKGAKRRSNPFFLEAMDCFAALAMTERRGFAYAEPVGAHSRDPLAQQ